MIEFRICLDYFRKLKINNDTTSEFNSNQIYDYNNNYYLTNNNIFNTGTSLKLHIMMWQLVIMLDVVILIVLIISNIN